MLSLFSVVGLALFAHTITSLPALPSSDDAGLSSDLGLDPYQLSTVSTDPGSSSNLDAPPSDNSESLLSQQLALNVDSSASAPPAASQDRVDPGCDKSPKGKRDTGGADIYCPADSTNPSAGTAQEASPKKTPEGQQQEPSRPINVKPVEPGSRGDLRLTPSVEPVPNPFGEKGKEPQCPVPYRYTVCGTAETRYDTWEALYTVHDADLVINSGFGYGMVVRQDWANRGGIAGWTDALEVCGPVPRSIYCCNVYFQEARQAYICDTVERAQKSAECWETVGLPTQTVLNCIENL